MYGFYLTGQQWMSINSIMKEVWTDSELVCNLTS